MIKLYYNNTFKWYSKDNIYTIGHVFFENKLYKDNEFLELIIKSKDNIKEIVKEFSGYFGIVINENDKAIIISDLIRSFPIFYTKSGDITDDINLLKGEINSLSIKELLYAGWIIGDNTIYKNIKQVENAEIVIIKDGEVSKGRYFEFKNRSCKDYSFKELDNIFNKIAKNTIKFLDGKTAIIPLSGGHDSRLLAYYLKNNGYSNIITYTYGNKKKSEIDTSRKIAEYLDVEWHFIEYTKKCKRDYKKGFKEIAKYCGRGYSIPVIQEWEAILELFDKKIIDKKCVVLPGYTLDFLSGNHIPGEFIKNDFVMSESITKNIYKKNYNLNNFDNSIFDENMENRFNMKFDETKIESKEANTIFETYDFEERQAKFINNAIRIYEYYGICWYLPFWDKELIEFWEKVPLDKRFARKWFGEFVDFKYKDLMQIAPIYKKENRRKWKIYEKPFALIYIYNNNFLNFYYYFGFLKFLKYVIKENNFNFNYYIANDYVKLIKENFT